MPSAIQHILNWIVSEIRVPLIMQNREPDISRGQIFPFSLQDRVLDARLRTPVAKCMYCSARLITELRWLNPPS
jgi:hypothetical protein